MAEPITELWIAELPGDFWIDVTKPECTDGYVRFVPAPVWTLYDPENPPQAGRYICESCEIPVNGALMICEFTAGRWWYGMSEMMKVRRYTPVPQPPEWVP